MSVVRCLRRVDTYTLTEWMLGCDWFFGLQRFTGAKLVLRHHSELILLTHIQVLHRTMAPGYKTIHLLPSTQRDYTTTHNRTQPACKLVSLDHCQLSFW